MTAELRLELVMIDSLSSISSKVESVRPVLSFLNDLAVDYRTALLLVHHLRKGGGPLARSGEVTPDDLHGSSGSGLRSAVVQSPHGHRCAGHAETSNTRAGGYGDTRTANGASSSAGVLHILTMDRNSHLY